MKNNQARSFESVLLISAPWPLFNRPSIQLGTLKSYLKHQFPDLNVKACHLYLKIAETIGYRLYQTVSEKTWLAETVYAALLYPERIRQIEKIFDQETVGNPMVRKTGLKTLAERVREVSDAFIDDMDWEAYGLVGFSICLCQFTSSIYFIKQIKQKFPDLKIVIGGSMFAGDSIPNLFQVFPEVDFVVNGEGELPLSRLVGHLKKGKGLENIPPITGLVTQKSLKDKDPVSFCQMETLKTLPMPDYDDYFDLLKTFSPQKRFFPTLSAEISRGCRWRQVKTKDKPSGCTFCNLNLQWEGYRSKTPLQAISEVDHMTTKYKTLSVTFMDNMLPVKSSGEIFKRLGRVGKDFNLFGEIRATTPRHMLETMRAGGVQEVQVGIEALGTQLLKKLNKGTTALQNLEIMKNCEELGIANSSNLILYFPGSDRQDVEDTLRNLEFAMPFRPLKPVHFWLGLGSPVYEDPKAFGIRAVFNHQNYSLMFPSAISGSMRFMIQAYRGDLMHQKKLWQPVKKKIIAWEKTYCELHKGPLSTPILGFQDGRDFLIIRQKRFKAETMTHRLVGIYRKIYLFCRKHRSLKTIVSRFPEVGEDRIIPFLKIMADKRLMFEEKEKYLSLAVPLRPGR